VAVEVGDTIGPYEIIAEIGEGGMAVVYHAGHTVLGSDHAIKILHERFIRSEETRHRFLDEGRIQAQLSHPHIVPVTDLLAAPGVAGLVMPLLRGLDLDALLRRDGALSATQAVEWTGQILLALGHVHQNGIIHRDLKPSNIFIEDLRTVRVMDFGIARVIDRSRTRTAVVMGTPAYMSPEQVRSPASVDARTDLFAVGCILYEMLAGAPAFDGETEFDIQSHIVAGQFAPLHTSPAHLQNIVARALAVDPNQRFQTAEEFRSALDGTTTVSPPAPAPAPKPVKVRRPLELGVFGIGRRNRLVMAALGAAAAGLIGAQQPEIPSAAAALIGAVSGYWLMELGCLATLLMIFSVVVTGLIEMVGQ
jgi:serine/threonine protein kinase